MRYFIADLHDMDENIITYTHRPFKDVKEQHEHFVSAWNERVSDEDEVFLLGDVGDPKILGELNGNIAIVCGNHDDYNELVDAIRDMSAYEDYVGAVRGKRLDERVYVSKHDLFIEPLLLTHAPATFLPPEFPYLNVHGHLHGIEYGRDGGWSGGQRYFNVAADNIGYAPISEDEIIAVLDY